MFLVSEMSSFLIYIAITLSFSLFILRDKLLEDMAEGDFVKASLRLSLVLMFSLVVSFRLRKISVSHKSKLQFILVVFILSVLFYPVISQLSSLSKSFKDVSQKITYNCSSESDKIVALIREFPARYEEVWSKYIFLSKWYINLEALVKVYGFRVSPNTNVAVGKNGFYFEGWGARKVEKGIVEKFDNIADYMGQIPFTDQELRQWKRVLEERKYWLKDQGIDYMFVLAPTKAFVYPEYLPNNLQENFGINGLTRYQQLTEYLQKKSDIHVLDLLPVLKNAKEKRKYPLLFYKTDFHWNFYGAFIAYQAIVKKLMDIFPDYPLVSPSLTEFNLMIDEHWAHHHFINLIGLPLFLHKQEHYITMVPKPGGRWENAQDIPEKGIYDVYPPEREVYSADGNAMKLRLIRNPDGILPSIMLLGDSFLEKCMYFFSAEAKDVMNIRTVVNFPDSVFHYVKPTVVIQEVLNMFLLRKPPKNPPEFSKSFLRAKFYEFSKKEAGNKEQLQLQKSEEGWIVKLTPYRGKDILQIGKLVFAGVHTGKISLSFFHNSQLISKKTYDIKKGKNVLFFEIPPVSMLRLNTKIIGDNNVLVPKSLEVLRGNY